LESFKKFKRTTNDKLIFQYVNGKW
jgi:hypothetical protein